VFLLVFLRQIGVPLSIGKQTGSRAMLVGVLVAIQSFCLYSAVAAMPVALALLVFNVHPMLFMLLSSATGKERLRSSALAAMPLALAGLALALDVNVQDFVPRWREIGPGVLWALGAALCFSAVMYLNTHWFKELDGRVRALLMMGVTAVLVGAGGAGAGSLALPADTAGWTALALLTVLYGAAITWLFMVLPRLRSAASTIALNFEPIAALAIAWLVLGQAVAPLQVVGAFLVIGAIAWLSLAKR
jgi:drug/metabolite transporter (DMT)-like permease